MAKAGEAGVKLAVRLFDNLDAGDARALVTLTPAVAGKR
jgi:hypothetical protein